MYRTNKPAFTFVELIVVITILAILATVGFVTYQEYISWSYDSNRIVQLNDVHDWLERLSITTKLPFPANLVNITMSWSSYAIQWDVDEKIIQAIDYNGGGLDPEFDTFLTIMLADNGKDFQLLTYVSDVNLLSSAWVLWVHAAVIEYWNLFPKTAGKPLWVIVDKATQTPLQRSELPINNTYDVINWTGGVYMYKSDKIKFDSSRDNLFFLSQASSCNRIQELWSARGNWNYIIDLVNGWKKEVYCDMLFAGWWWTLVWRSHINAAPLNFGWMIEYWSINNDTDKYSLWPVSTQLNFREIMIASYQNGKNPDKAIVIWVDDDYIVDSNNYAVSSPTSNCREFSQDWVDWNSSCDVEKLWNVFAHANWWFISYRSDETKIWFRDEWFFFRYYSNPTNSNNISSLYGLRANKFTDEGSGDIGNTEWMIFVR